MSEIKDNTREALQGKDLTVTRRPFETILHYSNMTPGEVASLPPNSVIVEVGSGEEQEFAQGVHQVRADLVAISIDPTLAISPKRQDVRLGGAGDAIAYHLTENPEKHIHDVQFQVIQKDRLRHAKMTGNTVAALAPHLPLADESTQLLIDSHAAGLYLPADKFPEYLMEIRRILKDDGEARIYPLRSVDVINPFKDKKAEYKRLREQAEKLISQVDGLDARYYFVDDAPGVILTKSRQKENSTQRIG